MAENEGKEKEAEVAPPEYNVAPSPHLSDRSVTTRRVMIDVLIGLAPLFGWGLYMFGWRAALQVGLCVAFCVVFEALFTTMCGKKVTVSDCSAVITGVILGLSLPASAPWYVAFIGSLVGIGIGKVVFGGIGFNIFNPAMVGRAFVMLSFAKAMGAGAYVMEKTQVAHDALTQATPLTVAKEALTNPKLADELANWNLLAIGNINGSIGEVSALCILTGGIYLIYRKAAAWRIPVGAIVGLVLVALLAHALKLSSFSVLQHLMSGAFLFGAFFIATDPVSTPLSKKGRFTFGVGYGILVMILRLFSAYPEGVMFAVLIMNALVPIVNRYTVPTPVGGPVPQRA